MKPAREDHVRIELPDGGDVTGFAAMPGGEIKAGIVLGHGAGTDLSHRLLVAVAHCAATRGLVTLRYNFPYAEEGRGAPDKRSVLLECCRAAFRWMQALPQLSGLAIAAGGKSMGGRIASIAVADGMEASGLVFLGYPLHPAGRTDELRVESLKRVNVPMLFVQGTRDRLCDLSLLEAELEELKAPCILHLIKDGDHSLNVTKRSGLTREVIHAEVAEAVCAFVEEL